MPDFKVHGESDFQRMRRQATELAAELEALRVINGNLAAAVNATGEQLRAAKAESAQVGALLIVALKQRFEGRLLVSPEEIARIPESTRLHVEPPRSEEDSWMAAVIEPVAAVPD